MDYPGFQPKITQSKYFSLQCTLNLKLLKWHFLKIEVTMLIFYLIFFQLWDIRDGMCKQTFPGHESDINAVTVKQLVTLFLAEI